MTSLSIIPAKTWALLIGCGKFEDPNLPAIPAVKENLLHLWELLKNPQVVGIPSNHIILIDENQPDIIRRIAQLLPKRLETLFVYYAGHGFFVEQQQLYLAKHDTLRDRPNTAQAFADLWEETIERHGATNLIYWLDCCYSGKALNTIRKIVGKNISVLTATLPNEAAKAPPGKPLTAFTECLIELLEKGVGNEPTLTTTEIRKVLRERLPSEGSPKAWGEDFLDDDKPLRIAYNRAYSGPDHLISTGSKVIPPKRDGKQIDPDPNVTTTHPNMVINGSVEQVTSVGQINGDFVLGDKIAGNKITYNCAKEIRKRN